MKKTFLVLALLASTSSAFASELPAASENQRLAVTWDHSWADIEGTSQWYDTNGATFTVENVVGDFGVGVSMMRFNESEYGFRVKSDIVTVNPTFKIADNFYIAPKLGFAHTRAKVANPYVGYGSGTDTGFAYGVDVMYNISNFTVGAGYTHAQLGDSDTSILSTKVGLNF